MLCDPAADWWHKSLVHLRLATVEKPNYKRAELGPTVIASAPAHLCNTYNSSARDTLMAVTMTISAEEAVVANDAMDCTVLAILLLTRLPLPSC